MKQLIDSIEIKTRKLIDKYNQLKIENTNLLKNNNDLQLVLDKNFLSSEVHMLLKFK